MKKLVTLSMCLLMAIFATACGNTEGNSAKAEDNNVAVETKVENNQDMENKDQEKTTAESPTDITIAEWEGSWNDFGSYLDDPTLDDAFKVAAEKEGKSADEVKSELKEKRKAEFAGLVVEGDKVTFLDHFQDKDGKEMASAEYKFTKAYEAQHGEHTLEWDAFEATSPDAKYPVLLMMPIHGEGEMTHFHMRYGNDVDELLAMDDWFPTFIKPSTTTQQLIDEVTE